LRFLSTRALSKIEIDLAGVRSQELTLFVVLEKRRGRG
jgi:hypothetical protein